MPRRHLITGSSGQKQPEHAVHRSIPTLEDYQLPIHLYPGPQPADKAICENGSTSFIWNGSGYTGLQWQVSTNGGSTWTDIPLLDPQYLGAGTNQLSIVTAPVSLNGNKYRLALYRSLYNSLSECCNTYS